MLNVREEYLNYKIDRLACAAKRQGNGIIIFGNNAYAPMLIDRIRQTGIPVNAIFDNNRSYINDFVKGIPVTLPTPACSDSDSVFLIASKYSAEMRSQLRELGYRMDLIYDISSDWLCGEFLDAEFMEHLFTRCAQGETTAQRLREKLSIDTPIYLSPRPCIGDLYLMCLCFNEFLSQNNITEYIIAVPGNGAANIAKYFGHNHIAVLTQDESNALLEYRMLMGETASAVYVLHSRDMHTCIGCDMLDYKKMTWLDNYNLIFYQLDKPIVQYPHFPNCSDTIWENLYATGFEDGNSVILAPHANSCHDLDDDLWEKLAIILRENGFKVYTNTAPKEKCIPNTIRLEAPLEYMYEILERAGYLIAFRSGFCDVVAHANCRKIILYPNYSYSGGIRMLEAFSLKKMKLCDDAKEIFITQQDTDNIITTIMNDIAKETPHEN